MTARVAELVVKIKGDSSSATKAVDSVSSKTSKFSGVATKAGAVAGKVLAGGLALAGAAAVKMTQAAAEDEAAQAKLANTLRNAGKATDAQVASVENWISAQGRAVGVSDDELRPALGKLVAATHDVGKAQKLAALAMDIAAGSGKSLDSVSAKLAKGVATGSVTAFAQFGVATKNAKGEALSMDAVLGKLGKTYKGAASDQAQTAAGKSKILAVQFGELQESIGAKLIPVLAKLTAIGLKVVGWIDRNQKLAGILIGTLGGLLATVYVLSKAIQAWQTIVKVATALQGAWNLVMAANPIVLVVAAIVALGVAFVVAYKKSETFRRIVNGVLGKVTSAAKAVIDWFRKNWKKALFVLLTGPFGLAVILIRNKWSDIKAMPAKAFAFIAGKVKAGWNNVLGLFRSLGSDVVSTAREKFDDLVSMVAGVPGRIINLGDKFVNAGAKLIGKFLSGLKQIGTFAADIGIAIGNALIDAMNVAIQQINDFLPNDIGVGPVHIDLPDNPLPSIPRIGGSSSSSKSLVAGGSGGLVSIPTTSAPKVEITVNGAVDPYSTAKQIRRLLEDADRYTGVRIGFAQ